MPKINPFQSDDLISSQFRSSKVHQVKSNEALNVFLQTQTFSTPKNNNNPSIFNTLFTMTQSLTHISRLGFAALALFTIIGGGLTAQAFAPENLKPLTLAQQLILKEQVKPNNIATIQNKTQSITTNILCNTLKVSNVETGDNGYGKYQHGFSVPNDEQNQTGRLNFYKAVFEIKCIDKESSTFLQADFSESIPSEKEMCDKLTKFTSESQICYTSYNIEDVTSDNIPFISNVVKNNIIGTPKHLVRNLKDTFGTSSDEYYQFNTKDGNSYIMYTQNQTLLKADYQLEIAEK
jgi:hypothetical protein